MGIHIIHIHTNSSDPYTQYIRTGVLVVCVCLCVCVCVRARVCVCACIRQKSQPHVIDTDY